MGDLTLRNADDYAFADAFIGCYVSRLMKWPDLVRLANCSDLATAQTILQEFGYGETKGLEDDDIEWTNGSREVLAFTKRMEELKLFTES